jgi:hypothetical protein
VTKSDEPSVARTRNRSVELSEETESGDKAGIERVLCVISGFAVTYGGVLRAPGHRRISPPMNARESLCGVLVREYLRGVQGVGSSHILQLS